MNEQQRVGTALTHACERALRDPRARIRGLCRLSRLALAPAFE
jgi:hypothetical protein